MIDLSVIICSHNPRADYLCRVLDALKAQTLSVEQWELRLVDNASEAPLARKWDLSWHPHARHIREDELGLTPARLRGIRESSGELLVFVDDDNVLAADYLKVAAQISKTWPMLGAWGGQKHPEFEVPLPEWTRPYWRRLAIVEFDSNAWSNWGHSKSLPCGAGMCVRRKFAQNYGLLVTQNPLRKALGRCGASLASGEDTDMVFSIYKAGYGSGLFADLHLLHLIDRRRCSVHYIARLCEGISRSNVVFDYLQNGHRPERSIARGVLRLAWAFVGRDRPFKLAILRGERKGRMLLRSALGAIGGSGASAG